MMTSLNLNHLRRWAFVGLSLVLLTLLTACQQRRTPYVIGVSQCSMDSWREKFISEMENIALISDSVVLSVATANDDDRQQMAQIDSLVEAGVDLLIVSPNQLHTISAAIDRAAARGIPVILYDRMTDSQRYTAFIGCDNYKIGWAMGQHVAQKLGGHGRVAEVTGLRGSSPAIERHRGFVDALNDYPDLHIVASVSGDWKEESGRKAMHEILRQTANIDYVFAHNDRMAIGARREAEREGALGSTLFAGVDALANDGGGLELVRDGLLDASYLYPTKGGEVLTLALKILTGKPFDRKNYLQTTIVTRDNAELTLMEAKDAERQRHDLGLLHGQVDSYVAQYESQKVISIALVVILALLMAIIVVIYRSLITKQRLNQQIVDLTHSRLVFFTNISHELRTPLTLIADPVEMLLDDKTISGRSRELLLLVQRNAQSLQQLVGSILDFRKVQNGKMTLTLTQFDVDEALTEWVGNFQLAAQRKHILLRLDTSASPTPLSVTADRRKLSRIVFNLLSNALKYTPQGGEITVALSTTTNDTFTISVSDTGQGIDSEEIDKVFNRFFQTRSSSGGTGIGLALVKAFAELHGGQANVESQRGKGSTFSVALPIAQAAEPTPEATPNDAEAQHAEIPFYPEIIAPEPAPQPTTEPTEHRPTILVIDDNADVRQYERMLLASRYAVIEAADGQEGLQRAREEVPDLVVCDVMMPVMDGLAFCQQLKSDTVTSHIPVVMLTAKALDEHRAEGYEQGADSYIAKPFHGRVLLARIDNLLRQHALLRQHFAQTLTAESPKPEEPTTTLAPREQAFLTQVNAIIADHLSDSDFNVEAIGQEIGLSRVQLYRKVKALTGNSVVDVLRKARLAHARHLLATTARTISEVAYDAGFSSPSYFTKCFRDEYGQTPGEFVAGQN